MNTKTNTQSLPFDPTHRLTPKHILDVVRAFGKEIGLDPATFPDNPTGARKFYTVADDGLSQPWHGFGLVFLNHPYSDKNDMTRSWQWTLKSKTENRLYGTEIISLLPVRTDAEWFHENVFWAANAICWIKGRVKHRAPHMERAEGGGRFPSCLAYYGPTVQKFIDCFSKLGRVTSA